MEQAGHQPRLAHARKAKLMMGERTNARWMRDARGERQRESSRHQHRPGDGGRDLAINVYLALLSWIPFSFRWRSP
jgi:hypothetical protein